MPEAKNMVSSDCPSCGCNWAEVLHAEQRAGYVRLQYKCDFCGKQYSPLQHPSAKIRENGAVAYVTTRCKHCNSPKNRVIRTEHVTRNVTKRRHSCDACGLRFDSFETHAARK